MGYGYYEINRFDSDIPMKRGYGVRCECHQRGCHEKIDRGMAYLCYSCGWYFCEKHLTWAGDGEDEEIEFDCFAGQSSQCCFKCARDAERQAKLEAKDAGKCGECGGTGEIPNDGPFSPCDDCDGTGRELSKSPGRP
jgi:hypothetical protein